jgi:hypothetical protein
MPPHFANPAKFAPPGFSAFARIGAAHAGCARKLKPSRNPH